VRKCLEAAKKAIRKRYVLLRTDMVQSFGCASSRNEFGMHLLEFGSWNALTNHAESNRLQRKERTYETLPRSRLPHYVLKRNSSSTTILRTSPRTSMLLIRDSAEPEASAAIQNVTSEPWLVFKSNT